MGMSPQHTYVDFGSWSWKITFDVCIQLLGSDNRTAAIEYLKNSGIVPIYVYFDLARVAMQTANKVAASFLKQLAYPPDQDRPFLRTIYENIKSGADRPSRQTIIDLFVQCSQAVNVRVLFDALDECNNNELGRIYQLIETLRQANIGVFLTTRPHIADHLRTRFYDASYMEDLRADEQDLRQVLDHRIGEHTPPIDSGLKHHILSRILNSRGTYLLATIVALPFRFLLASLQLEHVLRAKGNRNLRNALETMPSTTDKAFEGILERIERQEPGTANTAFRALTWCYYASRPLNIIELCDYLAVEDEQPNENNDRDSLSSVIDCCMSFITYNPGELYSKVRFIHPSVQRWFEREPQHQNLLSHAYLAVTCLTYLTLHIPGFPDWPFNAYAAVNWDYHTRKTEHEPAVQKAAFMFLREIHDQKCWHKLPQYVLMREGFSILHFLASNGFATLCKILLNKDTT